MIGTRVLVENASPGINGLTAFLSRMYLLLGRELLQDFSGLLGILMVVLLELAVLDHRQVHNREIILFQLSHAVVGEHLSPLLLFIGLFILKHFFLNLIDLFFISFEKYPFGGDVVSFFHCLYEGLESLVSF